MNPTEPVIESIEQRILELLGLEETFDLDYGTYFTLLKEALVKYGVIGKEKIPNKDLELLKSELKRIQIILKNEKKTKKFKIQSDSFFGKKTPQTSPKISSKKLLLPGSRGSLYKAKEIESKSKIVEDLKNKENKEQKLIKGKEPIDILSRIDEKLSSILETLISLDKLENKQTDFDRRERENKKRQEKESRLEKGTKLVGTAVQKILAPFQNIFERIWNFIKFTILGRAFTMLMDWLADPKNKGKIQTIGRFLKDWWPALLGAYGLFMTPFGGLVRTVLGTVVKFTFQITKFAIPKLLSIVKANPLTSLIVASSVAGTLARTGEREKLKPELEKQRESVKKTEEDKNAPWYQKLGGFFAKQELTTGQQQQAVVAPVPGAMYASGGFVSGESGIDKVPAMLSDGEFVMSRGAVAKFGTPFLEALNAAGGGTNKPKVVSGTTYAYGGGPVGNSKDNGSDITKNIKDFIKHKIGYDVDRPNTWGPSFAAGLSKMFPGSKSSGNNSPRRGEGFDFGAAASQLYNQGESGVRGLGSQLYNQGESGVKGLERTASQLYNQGESGVKSLPSLIGSKIPTKEDIIQTGSNFAKRGKDLIGGLNPLPKVGSAISNLAEKQYFGEAGAIERERKLGLMKPGADSLTAETKKRLAERDAYVKGLYNPEKDKGPLGFVKKAFQDVQNKGLIADPFAGLKGEKTEKFVEKISGGRVKNLGAKITGLQFAAKGLLGPLGRAFRIDDRGSLGRYLRPAMLEAQKRGNGAVGAEALGQETYDKLVGDKLANLALGQTSFTVDKSGRAKTRDVFDSNATAEQYFKDSRQALKALGNIMQGKKATIGEGKNLQELTGVVGAAKAAYQVAFKGLSGVLRVNQNTGWGNLRPMGDDIDLGGGFKPTDATGKVLNDKEIQKKKREETLKKFGPSVTLYDKPQANTGQPYKSRFARPKANTKPAAPKPGSKPSQPKPAAKPKRAWYDPRGWVGKQGGGEIPIEENTGIDIPGATADRQLIAVEPGESKYIVPKAAVENGAIGMINKIVAMTDSDSTPAKLGYRSKEVPMITPYSQKSSSTMTLPPIKNSSGGSMSMPTSPSSLPDFSVVPGDAMQMRMANAKLLGIV